MTNSDSPSEPRRLAPDIARDWRSEATLPTQKRRARIRRIKVGVASAVILVLVGALVWMVGFTKTEFARVKFIGIGITNYHKCPPHPGGATDVQLLQDTLSKHELCDSKNPMDDSLEGRALLDELESRLNEAAQKGERAIIYVSLHGIAVGSDVRLLTIKTTPDELISQSSESTLTVSEMISRIDASGVQDVLLLLDIGGLPPDWDLGVLSDEEPTLLRSNIESSLQGLRPNLNLAVLCSHSAGQLNWRTPAPYGQPSPTIFGQIIADALLGKADEFAEKATPDKQIQSNELIDYIVQIVDRWSVENRGVHQTVEEFYSPRFRELAWFPVPQVMPNDNVSAPGEPGVLSVDPSQKPTAGTEPLLPPESQANASATQTPSSAVGEKGQPASTDQTPTSTPPEGSSSAASTKPLTDQTLSSWKQLNEIEDVLCENMPGEYDSLVRKLRWIESASQLGQEESARPQMELLTKQLADLQSRIRTNPENDFSRITLSFDAEASKEISRDEKKKFDILFSDLAKRQLPMDGVRPPPTTELPTAISSEGLQARFVVFLIRKLKNEPEQFAVLGNVLDQLELQRHLWTAWPLELHHLKRLAARWQEAPPSDHEDWTQALDLRLQLVTLHSDLQRFSREPLAASVLPFLKKSLDELCVAERWLLAPGTHSEKANPRLQEAAKQMREFRSTGQTLCDGRKRLNRSMLMFPEYAAWLACYAETIEDQRKQRPEDMAAWIENLRKALNNSSESEVQAVVDAWPKSDEPFLENTEPQLFRFLINLRRLQRALQNPQDTAILSTQVEAVSTKDDELRRDMRANVAHLEAGATRSGTWVLLERTTAMSWLPLESRQKLRMASQIKYKAVEESAQEQVFSKSHGVWMGFWGGLTNDLISNSRIHEAHWSPWDELYRESLREDGARLVRMRAELGRTLAQERNDLRHEYEKSLAEAHGNSLEFLPLDVDRPTSRQEPGPKSTVKSFAELITDSFLDRLPAEESIPSELLRTITETGLQPHSHRSPELSALDGVECSPRQTLIVQCSPGQTLKVPYVLQLNEPNVPITHSKLIVELKVPHVRLKELPNFDRVQIDGSLKSGQLEFEVDREFADDSSGTIALLDEQGGPLDVRKIRLISKTDPTKFSIQLVATDGRRPQLIDKKTPAAGTSRQYHLMMAPNMTFSLRPVLLVPKLHKDTKVRVLPQYRDSKLNEWVELLPAWSQDLKAQDSSQPKELTLEFAAKETTSNVNLMEGLRFEIDVDGKSSDVTYFPAFRGPEQFVPELSKVQPSLEADNSQPYDMTLTIPTKRPLAGNIDLLSPNEIPIKLQYEPTQVRIGKGANTSLDGKPSLGESPTLKLNLEKGPQQFEFSVDIAGWPHAVRYAVDDSQVTPLTNTVRIRNVPPIQWLEQGTDKPLEPLSLTIEIDAPQIDDVEKYGTLILKLGIRGKAQNDETQTLKMIPIRRSRIHEVSFSSTKEHPWQWKTSLQDYSCPVDIARLSPGLREFVAELNIGEETLTNSVPIAIDDTKPEINFSTDIKISKEDPANSTKVKVTVEDPESGVRNLEIWLDSELQDSEPQTREFLYKDSGKDPLSKSSLPKSLQKEFTESDLRKILGKSADSTRYVICARCKNGAGQQHTKEIVFNLTPTPSTPGSPPAVPAKGELSISFDDAPTFTGTIELSCPSVKYTKSIRRDGSGEVSFEGLDAGTYTLTARRLGTVKSVTVKIIPGESKVVAVPK